MFKKQFLNQSDIGLYYTLYFIELWDIELFQHQSMNFYGTDNIRLRGHTKYSIYVQISYFSPKYACVTSQKTTSFCVMVLSQQ